MEKVKLGNNMWLEKKLIHRKDVDLAREEVDYNIKEAQLKKIEKEAKS